MPRLVASMTQSAWVVSAVAAAPAAGRRVCRRQVSLTQSRGVCGGCVTSEPGSTPPHSCRPERDDGSGSPSTEHPTPRSALLMVAGLARPHVPPLPPCAPEEAGSPGRGWSALRCLLSLKRKTGG